MELYKNTDWIQVKLNGENVSIPKDWNYDSFKKLAYVTDGTHSSPKTIKGTDYHYLTVRDLDWDGNIDFKNAERVSKEDYEKLVKGNCSPILNDILLSKDGTVGKTAIFNSNFKTVILSSLAIIRFSNLNYKYGYFTFKHNYTKENLFDHKNGNAIKRIVLKQLNAFQIFYPSEIEQNAIASLLSSQESIIKKTKDLIANIEKRNQFMMDELLSGRLRVKEENGQPVFYKNPDENWNEVKINGENVNVPKDWDSFKLKGNIEIKTGKKDANVAKKDGKYAFFTCGKQILKTDTYDFDCEAVLIAGNGDVGDTKYYQGKFDAYQRTYVLSNYRYDLKFLYIYMKKLFKDSIDALGSAMPYIKLGYLENFSVSQPKNLNERQLLLKVITSLNDEKQKYEQILEKEEKTFTFLLEELMSGRLRIKI